MRDAELIAGQLRELGKPDRAVAEKAYLKSELEHWGTAMPAIRGVVKQYMKEHRALTHDDLIALGRALWEQPVHERRVATVELLVASPKLLVSDDLPWVEQLLRESKTWALVDELARKVVGGLVATDTRLLPTLDRWVADDDFWIRRSAVLGLSGLLRSGRELDRFFRYADILLPEKEFFIRKVIGWVAREVGRRHPDEVSAWVRRNLPLMNGVTIREAVKYLPDGDAIYAAWRAR